MRKARQGGIHVYNPSPRNAKTENLWDLAVTNPVQCQDPGSIRDIISKKKKRIWHTHV